ncbi:8689_t:CDS:1 [Gigaspora margarita]|uniref:8689_t:CDS:1 n=1 Tax=Gigaspora margarita TaxID=4874 RepID=A0ABM8VWY4_GIGMA|nr:8689_t:CDS:1 [Gigaspora margarita]
MLKKKVPSPNKNSRSFPGKIFQFWKGNSLKAERPTPGSSKHSQKHLNSIETKAGLWNITINVKITDIFGIGILAKTFCLMLDSHYKFLEDQNEIMKRIIIIWEILILTVIAFYLGKLIDVAVLSIKLVDDGIRGTIGILGSVCYFLISGLTRLLSG